MMKFFRNKPKIKMIKNKMMKFKYNRDKFKMI